MTPMTMTAPAAVSPAVATPDTPALPGAVVAMHTTIAQDRDGQDVAILESARAIELTEGPRQLAGLFPGSLREEERDLLGDELRGYAGEQPEPAVLERLIDRGAGETVHVEALFIPLAAHERAELVEFLGDEDRELGRLIADAYAEDLGIERAATLPNGRVPMRDLKDYGPHAAQL